MRPAALLAGLALLLGPIATAAPATGTTWTLVNTTCSSSQVEVGRGCWGQGAVDQAHWAVHEGSASWTAPTFTEQYTYTVPGTVGPSGGAVALETTARDLTNNSGLNTQICVRSSFGTNDPDPCAHAHAPTPGSSNSGSATISLLPAAGAPGQTQTVTIGLQDGGDVIFTYRAQASSGNRGGGPRSGSGALHVTYALGVQLSDPAHGRAVRFSGGGGFSIGHIPPANVTTSGADSSGTARFEFVSPTKRYTLGLKLTASRLGKVGAKTTIGLTYTVTQSTAPCAPVGSQFSVGAQKGDGEQKISFVTKVCGGLILLVPKMASVSIQLK